MRAALRRRVIDRPPGLSRPCCARLLSSRLRILLIIHFAKTPGDDAGETGPALGGGWPRDLAAVRVFDVAGLSRPLGRWRNQICSVFVVDCCRIAGGRWDAGDGVTYDYR